MAYQFPESFTMFDETKCTELGQRNCIVAYNEALLDRTSGVANTLLELVLFADIIFAIACLKWRWLA